MKIFCLIDSLGPGGAQRQMAMLAALLQERGNEVVVGIYHDNVFYGNMLEGTGVKVEYIPNKKVNRIFKIRKAVKKFSPDAVVSYMVAPSIIACILKMTGLAYRLVVSERNTTQKSGMVERIKFLLYGVADGVVANSHSQGNFICRNFPRLSSKTTVITNYTDTAFFSPSGPVGTNNDNVKLLVAGRLEPQKNFDNFVRAVRKVVDGGYNIIVEWYGSQACREYVEEKRTLLKTLGLEGTVFLRGTSDSMRDVYRNADVFCLPSLYEGFSNVLSEAMCCGLPVLCGRVSDNPYIAAEGDNALMFDPTDVDDISSKIIMFLDKSQSEKEMMGRRSREIAEKLFDKETFVKKYLKLMIP